MKPTHAKEIIRFGGDILHSEGMQAEKSFIQHGQISCYEHSVRVAYLSLQITAFLHLHPDKQSMVRGALLHDYFLYDWHIPDPGHRLHGLFHAGKAAENAKRDFKLNPKEEDIIKRHMFPVNPLPPACKEGIIVCIADKLSAVIETIF